MLGRRSRTGALVVGTILVAVVLLGPSFAASPTVSRSAWAIVEVALAPVKLAPHDAPVEPLASVASLLASPRVLFRGASALEAAPGAAIAPSPSGAVVPFLITLGVQNGTRLDSLLTSLNDPNSSEYHQYLSAAEFTEEFAPNASQYATLVAFLSSFGISSLTQYPDRLTVSFDASPAQAGALFDAPIERVAAGATAYWAAGATPTLPSPLAAEVAEVDGLGPGAAAVVTAFSGVTPVGSSSHPAGELPARSVTMGSAGLPPPATVGSVQYLYPEDLQAAYDEQSLFDLYGFPQQSAIASILWAGIYDGSEPVTTACGVLDPGDPVGPYVPADLASFFSATLPSGEPVPSVVNVSVDGSPAPNCTAAYDTTGVVAANTAELETIGAMAPGATIYGVAVPGPSLFELESAFSTVLSPPGSLPTPVRDGLLNVSVVEIGWGTTDTSSVTWLEDLGQAEARGLSVVAATGDSGDDPHSIAWAGSDAEFPASAANNTVGALAVGGTTAVLNPTTDDVASEVVWNVSTGDVKGGGPAGSAGGVSTAYPEPPFQANTTANALLDGAGRGIPDVAAVANNSLLTLTVNGTQYLATNASGGEPFLAAHGTAVAAAYVAGLVAEIDHVLVSANASRLGFVDPLLYFIANEEDAPAPSGSGIRSTPTGTYDSELPTAPFYDVTLGRNYVYHAGTGYDLVSGWGSLDAYNYTMYVLHVSGAKVYGALSGVRDQLRLTGLNVTSRFATGGADGLYNASVQQTFFLANSLGAPVYWVQSIVYLKHVSGGTWAMNFTAWLDYPLSEFYPHEVIVEDWFPVSGLPGLLPLSVTLTTRLLPASGSSPPELVFTFGPPESPTLTLHAPGAAFIIGRTGYTYFWQGTKFTDGPKNGASAAGFLAPQLALVGAPPNTTGFFASGTAGNITTSVAPAGSSIFSPAETGLLTAANEQAASTSRNITFITAGAGGYDLSYQEGATTAGIYSVEAPYYPVTFSETGAPDGSTWYVNLSNAIDLTGTGSTPSVSTGLENGTYGWTATINVRNWSSSPASGSVTVEGAAVNVALAFGPSNGMLTFLAHGPETSGRLDFDWFVNITGRPAHAVGTALSYTANLTFGTYTYKVACSDPGYAASRPDGSIVVGATALVVVETFTVRTFPVEFVFHLPSSPPRLTITLGGISQSGSFGTWTLDEPNGSYGWSITGLPLGYTATPASGTVIVHGAVSPIVITVRAGGFGPFGLGYTGYALLGVVVGVPAVWAVVFFWRRSQRRRRAARVGTPRSRSGYEEDVPSRGRRPPPRRGEIPPDEL